MSESVDVNQVTKIIVKGMEQVQGETMEDSVVIVLGATGSGKSTLINALAGCRMKLFDRDELAAKYGIARRHLFQRRRFDVAPNSPVPSLTDIGHDISQSKTQFPKKLRVGDLVFWDNSGFLDTRGLSVRAGNAANLTMLAQHAQRVSLVITVDYNCFHTERAAVVPELLESLVQLFRDRETLLKHRKSTLVVVMKVPLSREDEKDEELKSLTVHLNIKAELKELWDKLEVVICDPLDRENLECRPVTKLLDIYQEICLLSVIENPNTVFHINLPADILNALLPAVKSLVERLYDALSTGNFLNVYEDFQALKVIQLYVKHDKVKEIIGMANQMIKQTIAGYKQSFHQYLHHMDETLLRYIECLFCEKNYGRPQLEKFMEMWNKEAIVCQRWITAAKNILPAIWHQVKQLLAQILSSSQPV